MAFRQPLILTNVSSLPAAGYRGTRTIYHAGNIRLHSTTLFFQQGQAGALTASAPATRGQIIAALERVELKVGTTTIREFSAEQLFTRQDILGYQQVPGALTVYFSNPLAASVLGDEITSWDLRGIPELQIVLTLNVPAAGTFFDVSGISSVDNVANVDDKGVYRGRFIREARWSDTIGAGRQSYFLIPRVRPFNRLWMFSEAQPTRVILRYNGVDVYDTTQTADHPQLASELAKFKKNPVLDGNGKVVTVWPLLLNPNELLSDFLAITPADQLELITEKETSSSVNFVLEQISSGVA